MTESTTSAQHLTGAAGPARANPFHVKLVAGGILFALALVAVMLRLHRLDEIPLELHSDEGAHGVNALQVLQGEHAVFIPENNGREGLIVYAIALSISLFGRTVLAVRLPTALASAATVIVVFWLGRLLFDRDENGQATPWRGLFFASVGAGLLAVSVGQAILGRIALRGNLLPLLLSLCLAFLWWGWRQRSWWRIALAGACAGLLWYTYLPARITPFLFLFFGLSFLLPVERNEDEGKKSGRRSLYSRFSPFISRLRPELPWAAIFIGVALLVAAPLLIYFALHPDHFFTRSSDLSIFNPNRNQGGPLVAFLRNTWQHLLVLGFLHDTKWYRDIAGQPMLNLWEAFFFWLGAGMAAWRWQRRPAYRLLLLWLIIMLLPAFLARSPVPDTLRMIGAAPTIYLLVAVGMWEALQFLRLRFLREFYDRAGIAVGILIGGLILTQGALTYRIIFQKWAAVPAVRGAAVIMAADLAQALNAPPSDADLVLIPSFDWERRFSLHYSFRYLYQGSTSVTTVLPTVDDYAKEIEDRLVTDVENASTAKVVEWNSANDWIEDDIERFDFLLRKYGRYLGSDEYDDFQIHNYGDISLDRSWTFYERLEPLSVHYDGGIAIHGLALGQGQAQLSTLQPLDLSRDRSMWGVLQWQTDPGLDVDYAISLRLYNAEGERVYQMDDILWNPVNHAPTSKWTAGEEVDSLFHLDLPADLPPGDYEFRLVVYDFETQTPTVVVGIWEPEVTLANLRLGEVR